MKLYLHQGDWYLISEDGLAKDFGADFNTGVPVEIPTPLADKFRTVMAALEAVQAEIEPYYESELNRLNEERDERERKFIGPRLPQTWGGQLLSSGVSDIITADEHGNAVIQANPNFRFR